MAAAPQEQTQIQLHWRARVVFELLSAPLKAVIRQELEAAAILSARGPQTLEVRGLRVTYESRGREGVHILEIR